MSFSEFICKSGLSFTEVLCHPTPSSPDNGWGGPLAWDDTQGGGTNSFVASFLSRLAAWSPTDVLFGFILIACLKNSSYPPTLQQYSEWQATVIVLELFVLTVQLSWKTRGQGSSPFLLFPLRLVCTTRKSHFQLALIFESHVSRGGEKKKESHMEDTNTFPPMLDPLLPTRGVSHAALE